MTKTSYDKSYYDSMTEKTRYLFRLIARNTENPFSVIRDYMNSDYRKNMDRGNPLFLNKTPKQILGSIGITVNNLFDVSETSDESVLEWMADVYTYLQWEYNLSSADIVEKIAPEELYEKYSPLHEASLSNSAEKLKCIYHL